MSTPRLPIPGQDGGDWGDILNQYLLVAHNNNGTLKAESIIVGKADKTYVDANLQIKANTSSLSAVATTGSYADLLDKPVIADDTTTVHLAGAQTITGEKNFTGGLKVSGSTVVATDDTRLTNTRTPSDDSVSVDKIQDDAITEPKLAISNDPNEGDFLKWDGSDFIWEAEAARATVTKASIGLGNVDNTSDANKPVSSAAQTALNLKANLDDSRFTNTRVPTDSSVTTSKIQDNNITEPKLAISNSPTGGDFLSWDGSALTWQAQAGAVVESVSGKTGVVSLVKGDVGLGNVDNTTDADKPVSTAAQTALNAKQDTSAKAQANGYASLDNVSLVPRAQLGTGTADGTKVLHGDGTWAAPGSAPVQSVAGKTGTVSLVKADVGLGNVDNTTDAGKPVSTATQTALDAKANSTDLATVAVTGSYVNLLNKPTIPVAGITSGTYAEGNDSRIGGAIQKSAATTKGDILVATGSATIDRLAVGVDTQVLTADSSQASGVKWSAISGGNGITRSIVSVSSSQTAGAAAHTDYVYIVTGSHTLTLPTAVGNTNQYTIKNRHSGDITLAFSASETADGGGITLGTNNSVSLVSDGSNWVII